MQGRRNKGDREAKIDELTSEKPTDRDTMTTCNNDRHNTADLQVIKDLYDATSFAYL